jgi:hypothetical protein
MAVFNSGVSIRNFLQTDEKPIGLEEYFVFWDSLSEKEKGYYRTVAFFELPS